MNEELPSQNPQDQTTQVKGAKRVRFDKLIVLYTSSFIETNTNMQTKKRTLPSKAALTVLLGVLGVNFSSFIHALYPAW